MLTPMTLLGLAIACCIAYALGRGKGLISLIALLAVAAAVSCTQSTNSLMVISYSLAFGWPVLMGTILLGAAAGSLFARGKYVVAPLLFFPFIYFVVHTSRTEHKEMDELSTVKEFVASHPGLVQLLGGKVEANLTTTTKYSDKNKGEYEFDLKAGNPLWAVVSVDRSSGVPKMQLECVTTVYMGHRDVKKGACDQGVVPLDGSTAVIVENVYPTDSSNLTSPTNAAKTPLKAFLPRFSPDTQVQAIGIYESGTAVTDPPADARRGRFMVDIPYSKKPLLLVLSSQESVQWVLNNHSREIAAVLTSGENKVDVAGYYGNALNIGNRNAYETGSPDHIKLQELVVRITKLPAMQFQGVRKGSSFTVPPN